MISCVPQAIFFSRSLSWKSSFLFLIHKTLPHWPEAASEALPCFPNSLPETIRGVTFPAAIPTILCHWFLFVLGEVLFLPIFVPALLKSENIRGFPGQPLVLLVPLPFLLRQDHLELHMQSDISERPNPLEKTFDGKSLTETSGLSVLWSLGNVLP